jgi:hypothetical protein
MRLVVARGEGVVTRTRTSDQPHVSAPLSFVVCWMQLPDSMSVIDTDGVVTKVGRFVFAGWRIFARQSKGDMHLLKRCVTPRTPRSSLISTPAVQLKASRSSRFRSGSACISLVHDWLLFGESFAHPATVGTLIPLHFPAQVQELAASQQSNTVGIVV